MSGPFPQCVKCGDITELFSSDKCVDCYYSDISLKRKNANTFEEVGLKRRKVINLVCDSEDEQVSLLFDSGDIIKCSKVILSNNSNYFKLELKGECRELKIHNTSFDDFLILLDYLKSDDAKILNGLYVTLFKMSLYFKFNTVHDKCVELVIKIMEKDMLSGSKKFINSLNGVVENMLYFVNAAIENNLELYKILVRYVYVYRKDIVCDYDKFKMFPEKFKSDMYIYLLKLD